MVNVTAPVGVPAPGAVTATVAVKVTGSPNEDGLADDTRAVVVSAGLTIWSSGAEVEPRKLPSPLYSAVMVLSPTGRAGSEPPGWPSVITASVKPVPPSTLSVRVMVPVGATGA